MPQTEAALAFTPFPAGLFFAVLPGLGISARRAAISALALAPPRAGGGFVAARTTLSGIGFAREYAYIEPTPMRRMIAEP